MNWTSRAPELQPALTSQRSPAPVPNIDVLRRAALQASWQRDRRIARRRTAVRWALWYGVRGLPLLLAAAAVTVWVLVPHLVRLQAPVQPSALPTLLNPPRDEPGIQLRLESPFQRMPPSASAPLAPATSASAVMPTVQVPFLQPLPQPLPQTLPQFSPQLKTDNWLHSKEP